MSKRPENIPEYVCGPTMRRTRKGDDSCDHEFTKEEGDSDVYWTCGKCPEKWAAEVYD
jgi:hypothetical protein